jgi:glycylpeptide N-tetradecanoyltransferase
MDKIELSPEKLELLKKMLDSRNKMKSVPKTKEEALKHNYKFWAKQPVTQFGEIVRQDGQITTIEKEKVATEAYKLPAEYTWSSLDLTDTANRDELVDFLDRYYVEDEYGEFRLHYSSDFIKWIAIRDNYDPELSVGIRVVKTGKLAGFVLGTPLKLQVNSKQLTTLNINFLCIHNKLRHNGVATLLITEITRRGQLKGYEQAHYTSGRFLPTPIISSTYYHRAINIETLINTGFTSLEGNTKLEDVKAALKLPDKISDKKFREIEENDVDVCRDVLMEYFRKYNIHPIFDVTEFKHIFFGNNYVTTYVLEEEQSDGSMKIVDMISYYYLPSTVLKKNKQHKEIHEGYLFYYTSNVETPYRLVKDILVVAQTKGIDVFNALDIMENSHIMLDLKFEKGSGILHYYLYNWRTKNLAQEQVALIPF